MHGKHKAGDEDQIEEIQQKVDDAVGEHIRYIVDILHHTHQNLPVRTIVIIGKRQFLQLAEQVGTDLVDNSLSHLSHNAGADGCHQRLSGQC